MASWKIGTCFAICSIDSVRTEIYSFHTRNHVIGPVYNYHQIPSQDYLHQLSAQKFKLFFANRNPLDVILSCINKESGLDKNTRIMNMSIFCEMARAILKQLAVWYPLSSNLHCFSYDKLMQNPISEIKKIMKILGVRSSTKSAEKIWNSLSFKQIATAPKNHYWSGGSGKWVEYFKREHLSFLKNEGIEEILEKYGFLDELNQFKTISADISSLEWELHCDNERLEKLKNPIKISNNDEQHEPENIIQSMGNDVRYGGVIIFISKGKT